MGFYKDSELEGKSFKVITRGSTGGQLAAIWSWGNGQPISQFIWNIIANEAFKNQSEIDRIIDIELNRRLNEGEEVTRHQVCRDIIMDSNFFEVADKAKGQQEELLIDHQTKEQLEETAKRLGKTPSQLIEELLKKV